MTDIILSDIEGRLDQITEIISDTKSSSEKKDSPTFIAQNEDIEAPDTSFYPQRRNTPNSSRLVAIAKVLQINYTARSFDKTKFMLYSKHI